MSAERGPEVGVGAVALRAGEILLVRRGNPPGRGRWSLPGGRPRFGEPMAAAVRRETLEETGLEVGVGAVAGVVERLHPEEGFHYLIVDFFVTVTGGRLQAGGDALEVRWVALGDLSDLPLVPGLEEALRDFGVIA